MGPEGTTNEEAEQITRARSGMTSLCVLVEDLGLEGCEEPLLGPLSHCWPRNVQNGLKRERLGAGRSQGGIVLATSTWRFYTMGHTETGVTRR